MNRQKIQINNLNIIVSLGLLILAFIVVLNKQFISDQLVVWTYSPEANITSLAQKVGFSEKAKFLFYASQPKLDKTSNFNAVCGSVENVTSILGCYWGGKIYVYDVTDAKLDGVREVTAAHETLHAAYARLSSGERKHVDELLVEEYEKIKDNKSFSTRMDFYSKTEPDQINNELHSLIGTEAKNIDDELEKYYSKYFVDRQIVIGLNEKYISVFEQLKNRADALKIQISAASDKISKDSENYNNKASTLNTDIASFNERAGAGSFATQAQFEYERSELMARISELTSSRLSINDEVAQYETMISEINSIATESKKLFNSIDSTLAPAPSI